MFGEPGVNGQTIKTKNYSDILTERYSQQDVYLLDTNNFKQRIFYNVFMCFKFIRICDAIVIMPIPQALKVLAPFFVAFKKIFKYKLLYVVIGGWLPDLVENNKYLAKSLKKFDGIYVETLSMKEKLEHLGISNVTYAPNFSTRKPILNTVELDHKTLNPYKLCTFSRVTKAKGITEAIEAVKAVNQKNRKVFCTLDIYGEIDPTYNTEFQSLLSENQGIVSYKGILDGDKVISTLSKYYLMLFPTFYKGEGFPGTVVEGFMAGVPIIASNWKYNSELIKNGETGIIYDLDNRQKLIDSIDYLLSNDHLVCKMRINCLKESEKYTPDKVMEPFISMLES